MRATTSVKRTALPSSLARPRLLSPPPPSFSCSLLLPRSRSLLLPRSRSLRPPKYFSCFSPHPHRYATSSSAEREKDVFRTLEERGFLFQTTTPLPQLSQLFGEGEAKALYVGYDPTAASLHVGSLLSIMAMLHFSRAGHKPVALVGGATGLIGDPSGRSTERALLDKQTLANNLNGIRGCLEQIFQHSSQNNSITIVNNADWYANMNVLDFLRDIGKHFRLGSMLAKETVKTRLERSQQRQEQPEAEHSEGMSFTEFSYPLLQGYDFLHLYRHHRCILQLGGSDQWGNITAGCELIRKLAGPSASSSDASSSASLAHGVTLPLLTNAAGEKLGKSAGNVAIWLREDMTSHYRFYQYFRSVRDDEVERLLRLFTFLEMEDIQQIMQQHSANPEGQLAQATLAEEVTKIVRGEAAMQRARTASQIIFKAQPLKQLQFSAIELLDVFQEVPSTQLPREQVLGKDVVEVAHLCNATKSKGEAKRIAKEGGLYLNNERVANVDRKLTSEDLVEGALLVLRVGKKSYHLVRTK